MPEPVRLLPCPTCRKPAPYTPANKYRPFCSERCRLIDFGGWTSEQFRIEGEPLRGVMSEDLRQGERQEDD